MSKSGFPEFVVVWNNVQGLETPSLHIAMCRWLQNRWDQSDRELLLLAFRDSGKSTLTGLFCAWLLTCDPDLRILVLAADLPLARKMVRNVKRVIERHPLTRGLKPVQRDQWAAEQFTVVRPTELRDPSMLAKGIGGNITGSRADVVICDDVEVPNTSDTAGKRQDLRERLAEIDYVLVPGGLRLFIGTPHTYFSIYSNEPRAEAGEARPYLHGFQRLELPVLFRDGRSRWPERFSLEKIEAIRDRSGPAKFASQMMLKPVNIAAGRLDPDRLGRYDDNLVLREANGELVLSLGASRLVSATCWWDPAYGSPDKGDSNVVAAVFTDESGYFHLHAIRYLEHDPSLTVDVDEATQLCRQIAGFVEANHLPAVSLETNGLGRFLPGLLRRELVERGLRCAVVEKVSRKNKDLRIIAAFDAVLAAGRLRCHSSVWNTPFLAEMREWRPGGKASDDGLDAVAGCLASEPVRLPRNTGNLPAKPRDLGKWRGIGTIFHAKTGFLV